MKNEPLSPLWRVGRAVGIVAVAVIALLWVVSWLPGINPFTDHTEDRSQPVLLKSVRDLSQYHAAVQIRLPEPRLDKPNIDQERTYLYSQERGVWDRVKALFDTPDQKEFYVLAEDKIADAATDAGLTARAERNTRQMLTGLLDSLGYRAEFPAANT